ncbi:MAG: hypothetical protein J7K40_07510 [candidate division Zixibacteria bacterium]|nr:hypothetical protein [candidate division Zixibacteria bacterium]
MSEPARQSIAKSSLVMLSAQAGVKILGFFLPCMPPECSVLKLSDNMVLP